MMIHRMKNLRRDLQQQIQKYKKELRRFPQGELFCARNGLYVKWYHRKNDILSYLPKRERHLAQALSAKKYYELKIQDLESELNAVDAYLSCVDNERHSADDLMLSFGYEDLLRGYFQQLKGFLQNENLLTVHPENATQKTHAGNFVRSKSEQLIDMALTAAGIRFEYEVPLTLEGETVIPDFKIIHPVTDKIIYWEHFGLMDDPAYIAKTAHKIELYAKNGIVPSVNLIMTFETKDHPLDSETIAEIIEHFFG